MKNLEDKISLMIPAYLRGDLSEAERLEVETCAAENPAIAADIEFQKNLKDALKPDEAAFKPGELDWARLSKSMEQEGQVPEYAAQKKPQFWRYAAAILAVAAIGQAGVLGSMAFKGDTSAQYQTASEQPVQSFKTKLGFNPSVTESELREALLSHEASIVAGPSSLGLYDIQFSSKASCMSALKAFKARKDIVDTVSNCE